VRLAPGGCQGRLGWGGVLSARRLRNMPQISQPNDVRGGPLQVAHGDIWRQL